MMTIVLNAIKALFVLIACLCIHPISAQVEHVVKLGTGIMSLEAIDSYPQKLPRQEKCLFLNNSRRQEASILQLCLVVYCLIALTDKPDYHLVPCFIPYFKNNIL